MQLAWFGMMFGDYDSFGRLDQYLGPFLAGEGEACAWLASLWRKVEEHGAIINMTIGGCRPDGADGVNALTFLALRTTRELGAKSPNLCLRIGPAASDGLWREVHRSLGSGQSLPALYNDDLVIPMLERRGIPAADARDYCLAGCSQVVIPGRSSFACDIGVFNALKCLELALHDGRDPRSGRQAGPRTGAAGGLAAFEAVLDAWKAQVRHAVRAGTAIADRDTLFRKDFCSCVRSLLTADCLERGRGIFRGGARYNAVQHEIVGLTNTANALAGIRQVVFDDRALGLEELVGILDRDWAGREDVRQTLLERAPKFGNDDDRVDGLRAEISRFFYDEVSSHPAAFGRHPLARRGHLHLPRGPRTVRRCVGGRPPGRLSARGFRGSRAGHRPARTHRGARVDAEAPVRSVLHLLLAQPEVHADAVERRGREGAAPDAVVLRPRAASSSR